MKIIDGIRDRAVEVCEQKYPTRAEAARLIRKQIDLLNDPGEWKKSPFEIMEEAKEKVLGSFIMGRKGVDSGMKESTGVGEDDWMRNPEFIAKKVMMKVAEILEKQPSTESGVVEPDTVDSNADISSEAIEEIIVGEINKVAPVEAPKVTITSGIENLEITMIGAISVDVYNQVVAVLDEIGLFKILDETISRGNLRNLPTKDILRAVFQTSAKEIIEGRL